MYEFSSEIPLAVIKIVQEVKEEIAWIDAKLEKPEGRGRQLGDEVYASLDEPSEWVCLCRTQVV